MTSPNVKKRQYEKAKTDLIEVTGMLEDMHRSKADPSRKEFQVQKLQETKVFLEKKLKVLELEISSESSVAV